MLSDCACCGTGKLLPTLAYPFELLNIQVDIYISTHGLRKTSIILTEKDKIMK
jgi:hypothetical protein